MQVWFNGGATGVAADYWDEYARHYARLGPPQVPVPSVVRTAQALGCGGQGPAVLLGVTPGYADIAPDLLAFDSNAAAVAAIWPGDTNLRKAAVADWTALPIGPGSVACVYGDGSLNAVPGLNAAGDVLDELRRVLRPGGRVVVRLFAQPVQQRSLEDIFAEAAAGKGGSIHTLKWRVACVLAEGPDFAVPVKSIRSALLARFASLDHLAAECGFTAESAATVEAYRDTENVYNFPTRQAFGLMAGGRGFECRFHETEGYILAGQCPLAVLLPRA